MALPSLSPQQRQDALEKATAARRERSELLSQVKNGTLTLAAVLERADTDQTVKNTKVLQLVKALPGYGPAKTRQLLEQAQIPDNRKIGGLGQRQRQALLDAVA